MGKILVCGGGGFIGGHLVKALAKRHGPTSLRVVDVKPTNQWYQLESHAQNLCADLNIAKTAFDCMYEVSEVYNLAANMGGIGFIEHNRADCAMSVVISAHLLAAASDHGIRRYFYSSSACVYAADKQDDPNVTALKESDAYPASPEAGYGEEKLFSERLCEYFYEDYGLQTRVARLHNAYGPYGTYDGGREKAPAAICRKVIEAQLSGNHVIDIWGDGNQTRSFMYVDDCVEGMQLIMHSDAHEPINLGSSELVTINELVDIVEEIAGVTLKRNHDLSAPQGVRGRNSDNTLILDLLEWEPKTKLRDGLEKTYEWIYNKMVANG